MSTRRSALGGRAIVGLGAGVVALAAGSAQATWSILIANTRTGEIAAASATCLTGFDLKSNTPVLLTGVGAATAQSSVDLRGINRGVIRSMLLQDAGPAEILAALELRDSAHQTRQYGMLDASGETITFSGSSNAQWAGGQTGQVGDLVYAIQGNILTGAPVVQAAVDAVLMTPGDIPAKLMAAMEAAALFGGDGRCSCPQPQGPTDCGSPPNGGDFEKSAHIAYMLIARTGDKDGCNQILDTRGRPADFVIGDFNFDTRPDVITATSAASMNVAVIFNVTSDDDALSTLAVAGEFESGALQLRIASGDFTGDETYDTAVCSESSDVVIVFPGGEDGLLGKGISTPVGAGPRDIAAGDFDGANAGDIATVNADGSVSILLNTGVGTFDVTSVTPVANSGTNIATGDFDGDGDTDLAIAHDALGIVTTMLNDGAGTFTPGSFTFVGAGPMGLVVGDFNGDLFDDLATPSTDAASISVLLGTGAGFSRTDVPTPGGRRMVLLAGGRMDEDGDTDLVAVLGQPSGIVSVLNDGNGTFAFGIPAPIATGVTALGVGDFNSDGLDDVIIGASGVSGIMVAENQGGGMFLAEEGCATGDYFMTFNVPNTIASDPDPVITLREMYDIWRAELVGRPDAVRSVVTGATSLVASTEGPSSIRLRVELRDWQSQSAELGLGSLSAALGQGSDGVVEVGEVLDLGGGVYEIELIAGAVLGRDVIEIVADDGVRPVTLMPVYAVEVLDSRVDFDGDGVAGFGDVLAFLQAFAAQDPSADLDTNTMFDAADVMLFLGLFAL